MTKRITERDMMAKSNEIASGKYQQSDAICLITAARALRIPLTESMIKQIQQEFTVPVKDKDFIKISKRFKVKVKIIKTTSAEIPNLHLPAAARMNDGTYLFIGRFLEESISVYNPATDSPQTISLIEFYESWSGTVLAFSRINSIRDLIAQYNLEWFTGIVLRYKRFLGEVLVASFFLQILGVGMPLFTQVLVDKVISNNGIATLDVLAIGMLVIGAFQSGMKILQTYLLTHTTNKIDTILGTRLFRHVVSLPVPYFERQPVGDILLRISMLSVIRNFLTGTFMTVVLNSFFSVAFLALMLCYSVPLTLIAMAALPVYLLQTIVAAPIYKKRLQKSMQALRASNIFLVETITGIHTVKSLAIEPQLTHRWENILAHNIKTSFDTTIFSIGVNNIADVIQRISGFAVLWYGGHMVMDGKMTLGQLIAFQMLANQANTPIMGLVNLWPTAIQTTIAFKGINSFLVTKMEPVLLGQKNNTQLQGRVRLEKVTFRYTVDTEPVLKDISLTIEPGMRVGIVGRSGSGKSTLTKLIQRLYEPETGRVLVDEQDLAQVELQWLRRQIGVVMQENYLFNGSVRENIALARPSASMEEVIQAAQSAGAHEFILELPEGYDTRVGERGTSLSGGQRQRVAIARALLADPRIIIFDEATSALDYESERIIMKNLDQICLGRTMIMIAHRLSTVRHCDLLIVVDRGCIVERGTHEQLLAERGLYYKLYTQQEGYYEN